MTDEERDLLWVSILNEHSTTDKSVRVLCSENGVSVRAFTYQAKLRKYNARRRTYGRGHSPTGKRQLKPANCKHGVYAFRKYGVLNCDACAERGSCVDCTPGETCGVLATYQAEVRDAIMSLEHIKPQDSVAVELAIRELSVQWILMRYQDRHGMVLPVKDGVVSPQPILKVYWTSVGSLSRLLAALALTPASRQQLNVPTQAIPRELEQMISRR